jgi:hypothetical protein
MTVWEIYRVRHTSANLLPRVIQLIRVECTLIYPRSSCSPLLCTSYSPMSSGTI